MGFRGWMAALLVVSSSLAAMAQSGTGDNSSARGVPRLGDIMTSIQFRHIKLWSAGQARNWPLARYELGQIRAGLVDAASMYAGIPVDNVTTMVEPVQAISDAIDGKDNRKFAKAFGYMTAGCNGCHQSIERGFIVMQTPTGSPFSDQSFAPSKP